MARVLIADDHEEVRGLFSAALRRAGHETVVAVDGDDALRQHASHGADVAVIDLVMPGPDSLETIRELRERSPSLKIIAISEGRRAPGADDTVLREARRRGADIVLAKPLDPSILVTAVDELLQ